jgi:hypothetical protein
VLAKSHGRLETRFPRNEASTEGNLPQDKAMSVSVPKASAACRHNSRDRLKVAAGTYDLTTRAYLTLEAALQSFILPMLDAGSGTDRLQATYIWRAAL